MKPTLKNNVVMGVAIWLKLSLIVAIGYILLEFLEYFGQVLNATIVIVAVALIYGAGRIWNTCVEYDEAHKNDKVKKK